ncbi:MAG: SRPBCC family protein [Sediminimonas qiaohouensis]|uniref:SRPBCC family protein n=1 Tax=Sediminimonas qiaohouensis TaxID=552061 RepID=A0A7C9L940_9RHOB|nr:SRPBCC family protein [Sediminimonas qiaohouensis]MTJ05414.1 SRPBCC family protein [Sediminimonas qiaohouensis]
MKFSTKEDVDAPISKVFDTLADFEMIERAAMRRGVEVQRTDTLSKPGIGASWHAKFNMRGKQREVDIFVPSYDPPNEITMHSQLQGLQSEMKIELVALSRQQTRLSVVANLKPTTLSARLLVQSLKMARTKLNKRFRERVADYARELQERAARL